MRRIVLDTSVLIADTAPTIDGAELAVSVVSVGELHFGLLLTDDPEERARRAARVGAIEERFRPLPVDGDVARAWGALCARVRRAGAQPRRRSADLLIAATARVHDAAVLTFNAADLRHVADVVTVLDARSPGQAADGSG